MTTDSEGAIAAKPRYVVIRSHVRGQVTRLQRDYLKNQGSSGAAAARDLAQLRRMDPLDPGGDPLVFGLIFDSMPDSLVGHGDDPSAGEVAVCAALHLFSLHQQGLREPVQESEVRFGSAIKQLAFKRSAGAGPDDSVITRFYLLCRASSEAMRITQMRALIKLMRSERIGFDYGQLAVDLDALHRRPGDSTVYLKWGRDFHQTKKAAADAADSPAEQNT